MDFSKLRSINTKKFSGALNWLMPKLCIQCGEEIRAETLGSNNIKQPCCNQCYTKLPFQTHCCRHCDQNLGANRDYCGRCLNSPPAFDACFCPFQYEAPISELIQQFKYSEKPEVAKSLATLLFNEIENNGLDLPDLLIPVPLHISRLRERGYNQSLLLTKELSKHLHIPYSDKVLEKHRATPAQAQQSLKQRKTNVRGSFRIKTPPVEKNVAIVDDVFTTGATAGEIAKILKQNGVHYVHIWGIAHTI